MSAVDPHVLTWSVGDENAGGGANVHAVVDGQGLVVAWTARAVVAGRELISDEQAKKNAHLVAAAPALRNALLLMRPDCIFSDAMPCGACSGCVALEALRLAEGP